MIVTINDYRGIANTAATHSDNEQIKNDSIKFTVAAAGGLKLRLQALNNMLVRTPIDQHHLLELDDIIRNILPRTYVNGSEEVYFKVKGLSWPSKIPEVFVRAYGEVLRKRPFTNEYNYKTVKVWTPYPSNYLEPTSAKSASTFSTIRPLLPELDTICDTKLDDFFQRADSQVKPFAFMRLPTELRLEVFDYLVSTQRAIRLGEKEGHDMGRTPTVRLDIMRVSKALHKEIADHFFNTSTLYIEAYIDLRRGIVGQAYFTKNTAAHYAARITEWRLELRSRFTQLEIRIIPEDAASPINSYRPGRHDDTSLLRRICAALPHLESILISFEKVPQRLDLLGGQARWPNELSYYNGQKTTLSWIHAQLPDEGLRVAWDLTHFRRQVGSAALLRKEILSQPMMKQWMEMNGPLELAQSATATREDLQRWSELKDVVTEAVARL